MNFAIAKGLVKVVVGQSEARLDISLPRGQGH